MRPLEQLILPIHAVLIPALSRCRVKPDHYRRTFLEVFEAIASDGLFVHGLFLALSKPVTLAVLGPKWEGAA